MQVIIQGKTVKLNNKNVLGVGGEATVFRHQSHAVKIYLTPTPERDHKLRDFLPHAQSLPPEVIAPEQLAFDPQSNLAIGFTMRLLDARFVEVRKLSNKTFRATSGITSRDVAHLFLNAHQTLNAIHQAGVVVGDLNDLNLMFHGPEMLFIDVDSFQFGPYPCMVGTEAFLDPGLYGIDLAQRPHFRPDHDWYSFAVLLFKSLLLTHPYGGVHPTVNTLTDRAQRRINVFDPAVQYPKIAYRRELLTDDLVQTFENWFSQGKRGVFPEAALQNYVAALTICPACGASYPSNRRQCPVCAAVSLILVIAPQMMSRCQTVIQTKGKIVYWQVNGSVISLVAYENGKAVYYRSESHQPARSMELFEAMPTAAFAFAGDKLIVSPASDSDELMVIDVSGAQPAGLLKTTTGHFGNGGTIFGANGRTLYRLAGGYLMRGEIQSYGSAAQLVEQPALSIAEDQTWMTVAPNHDRVFGYFRTLNTYQYWLLDGRSQVEVALPPLDPAEPLIQMDIKFATNSVLVLRHTQLNGVDRVHIEEIDVKGKVINSQVLSQLGDFDPINTHAYATGMVLHATDGGIVQEKLDSHQRKLFNQTEPFVGRGDALYPFEQGLLVVHDDRVLYLTL